MSARTAYRTLRRNRANPWFGDRLWIIVRIPLDAVPPVVEGARRGWDVNAVDAAWEGRVGDAMDDAACAAHSAETFAAGEDVDVMFTVKPLYRDDVRRLAAGVARFVKHARRDGIAARYR